jgi:hypothetical protein
LLALREDLPDFFTKEVLGRLDPTDRAVLARVGWPWLTAVVRAANEDHLPCAGNSRGVPLKLVDFVGSVARLAWAKANGCPWREVTGARGWTTGVTVCTFIAKGGSVEALQWARVRGCPWTVTTCAWAAKGGHLAGPGSCCPPRNPTRFGPFLLSQFKRNPVMWRVYFTRPQHLDILKWAREHGCPWDATTCKHAANGGHLEMLQWAHERDCPWDAQTCSWAAIGGHLEVSPGKYCPTRHPPRFESSFRALGPGKTRWEVPR